VHNINRHAPIISVYLYHKEKENKERRKRKMHVGVNVYGKKCVYDLPDEFENKTWEELNSLICGYHFSDSTREELQGQPKMLGLVGPMFNGYGTLASTGEKVAIIRYEEQREYY
jgi:hypothetical protein